MTSLVGAIAEHVCRWCACVFQAPLSRTCTGNFFCSEECRLQRRRDVNRRSHASRESRPERIAANRARNRAWRVANRGAGERRMPWLAGSPPSGESLPCVELDVAYSPAPKWPVDLRNMRGIHGAVTALLAETVGIRHREHTPTFAARIHDERSVRVVVWDERATNLADGSFAGVLWDRPTTFAVRDMVEVAAPPRVTRRGRIPVRLTTVTPITMSKDGHTRAEVRPTQATIERSLRGSFLERVGLQGMDPDLVRAEVTSIRTEPAHVPLGGKYGVVGGWSGQVDLEVNAPALWLLQCAEKVGLGSRVSFGFGRIVVEEIDAR